MGGKVQHLAYTRRCSIPGWCFSGGAHLSHELARSDFARPPPARAEWLLAVQEPNGRWVRGNSKYADPGGTLYNVMARLGFCAKQARHSATTGISRQQFAMANIVCPGSFPERLAPGLLS